MARIDAPQLDLPDGVRGGSDIWGDGLAGVILSADFFDAGQPGSIKVWGGAAWVTGALRRWDGVAWVDSVLQRWDGAAWVAA